MRQKSFISLSIILIAFTIVCSEKQTNPKAPQTTNSISEELVAEVKSKYSHIKVADYGSLRQLYFVRDSGEEALESTIDLNYPQNLFLLYTQTMFASFFLNKEHGAYTANIGKSLFLKKHFCSCYMVIL